LQRRVNGIAILIVLSNTPKIGARAGLNVQRGPHWDGGEA
jgi:hypothetical protein